MSKPPSLEGEPDWSSGMRSPRIANPMKSLKSAATNSARTIKRNMSSESPEPNNNRLSKAFQRKDKSKRESVVMDTSIHRVEPATVPGSPQQEGSHTKKSVDSKGRTRKRDKKRKEAARNGSQLRRFTQSSLEIRRALEATPQYHTNEKSQYVSGPPLLYLPSKELTLPIAR